MKKLALLIGGFLSGCCAFCQAPYDDLDVEAFAAYIRQDGVQLVDVRTADEVSEGMIAGATHLDVYRKDFVKAACRQLDKKRPVAVYCRSGKRSAMAAAKLAEKGFKVVNLSGGFMAWTKEGMPVEAPKH